MSDARVMQTVIQIDGLMSASLKKAVNDVNKQLSTIDKKALETAANIGGKIGDAAKTAAAAVAGIATAAAGFAAGAFVKGGQDYIRTMNGIQAQTGATAAEMQEFGQIAQDIYKSGKGEDLQQIANTLTNIRQASGLAGEELKTAANAAMLLSDSFGMESEETTRAATALMKNFGITAEEAYGLIAVGAQNGANKNGDLLDTLNEYSVHYKALGLSADEFVQSLINGADAGSFSIDKIGDAVKEFTIRSKDGSESSKAAFEVLGLNAENMTAQFAAGGRSAEAAFFQVVQALNAIEDPVEKNMAGVALFGTMFEDLEAGVLSTLGGMSGASLDAAASLREIEKVKFKDTGYALSQISRTLETALIPSAEAAGMALYDQMPRIQAAIEQVTPYIASLGESFANAIPGIIDAVGSAVRVVYDFGAAVVDNWGVIGPMVYTVAGAFAAFKIGKIAVDAYAVGKAVGQLSLAYGKLYIAKAKDGIETAKILALYAKDAVAKALSTARTWASVAATYAQTAATAAWSAAATVAQGVTMALGAAIRFMTGPIGLAFTAITGLVAAGVWLYKNWDTVKAKAAELGAALGAKWAEIKTTVSNLAAQLGDFVGNVWTRIKDGAASIGESIKGALSSAFQAIPGILKAPINAAISLINGAIGAINGIGFTIPEWIPGIGGKAFSVNVPTIPMLAKGGFTTGPSIAGEAGTEAVISFDPAYRAENIGYLARAASMLGLTRDAGGESIGSYAARIDSLATGEPLASSTSTTTYNLGGINFAPNVTVKGGDEKKDDIIEQLRAYQGELLELVEELLEGKEKGSYAATSF